MKEATIKRGESQLEGWTEIPFSALERQVEPEIDLSRKFSYADLKLIVSAARAVAESKRKIANKMLCQHNYEGCIAEARRAERLADELEKVAEEWWERARKEEATKK